MLSVVLVSSCILFTLTAGMSLTVTWSTPRDAEKPSTGSETLKAIKLHLNALHLANSVPRLLGLSTQLQIKLCPPQPYDPLVKEFTVPRLSGFSLIYDQECIEKGQQEAEVQWGKKKQPPNQVPGKLPPIYGQKGLTVPAFLFELLKYTRSKQSQQQQQQQQIWLIDSDSLQAWYTAPLLNFLAQPKTQLIPPADLMRQINAMYGSLGEKDLKNMPQAVQGALLIVLPDYSTWQQQGSFQIKSFFNPTWWNTRFFPRSQSEIFKYCKEIIEKRRIADQLVIIHHEPTSYNFEVISLLTAVYGEKAVISSTRVLPKTATTMQLLQFMQKAAGLVVDKRDTLGQLGLLAAGFTNRVASIQSFLPYTTAEYILYTLLTIWFIGVVCTRAFYTHKLYTDPLHLHAKRFALFFLLALAPIHILNPSLWPETVSMLVFSLFEAGYALILYIIVAFYATAGITTAFIVVLQKYRKSLASSETDEELSESDTESIQLIPK